MKRMIIVLILTSIINASQYVPVLVGGEIEEYTKLQADAREQALQRMIDDAAKYNADAIVNVRFTTSVITQAASEVLAYGTAVTLK